MAQQVELFSYNDYQLFLNDYIAELKENDKKFSIRSFAKKSGYSDHSQLSHILNGRRDATVKATKKLISGLELNEAEANYFSYLVAYTQTRSMTEKKSLYEKMNVIRKKSYLAELSSSQYQYFEEWYYPIVLELCTLKEFDGDLKKLGKQVKPSISERQVKQAIKLLLKIGILKEKSGKYIRDDGVITPGSVPMFMIHKARHDLAQLGAMASETSSPSERYLLNYTFKISEDNRDDYQKLCKEFEEKLEALTLNESGNTEYLYHCNLQFFPTTVNLLKGE